VPTSDRTVGGGSLLLLELIIERQAAEHTVAIMWCRQHKRRCRVSILSDKQLMHLQQHQWQAFTSCRSIRTDSVMRPSGPVAMQIYRPTTARAEHSTTGRCASCIMKTSKLCNYAMHGVRPNPSFKSAGHYPLDSALIRVHWSRDGYGDSAIAD